MPAACACRRGARPGHVVLLAAASRARAVDESPPPILQWFESSYRTMEERDPDLFMAGYGFVWVPPPFRADHRRPERRLRRVRPLRSRTARPADALRHRDGPPAARHDRCTAPAVDLHVDFVMNHNGFSNLATPGFAAAGGYPGSPSRCRATSTATSTRRSPSGDAVRAARRPDRHRAREEPPLHPQPRRPGRRAQPPRRARRPRSDGSPTSPTRRTGASIPTRATRRSSSSTRRPARRTSACIAFNLDDPMAGDPVVGERHRLPHAQRPVADPGDRRRRAPDRRGQARRRASSSTSSTAPSTGRTRAGCSTGARRTSSPTARSSTATPPCSCPTSARTSTTPTRAASAATATPSTSSSTSP